jgi:uncharacterized protein YqeY
MLRERLDEDMKAALRQRDTVRLSVIRQIKAAVLAQETRSTRTTLDDDGILGVIAKELKERQDVLAEFERAGRRDLVDKAQAEMRVLEEYLPPALSAAELDHLVDEAVRETGATGPKDMGKVMAWMMPRVRGRADGRVVSERVQARLRG